MFSFFSNSLKVLFNKTNIGIAFNLMSKHVDYERDDLFHVGYDELANFLTKIKKKLINIIIFCNLKRFIFLEFN